MTWFSRTILKASLVFLPILFYLGMRIFLALRRRYGTRKTIALGVIMPLVLVILSYPMAIFLGYELGYRDFVQGLHRGNPRTDPWLVVPFWLGLAFALQALPGFILTDIGTALALLIGRIRGSMETARIHIWGDRLILILTVFLILYVPVRVWRDTAGVQVDHRRLKIAGLHADLKGLRIVHISDVQADPRTDEKRLRAYMKVVNDLRPDLVIFTGDLVTSGTRYVELGARMLGLARAKYGTYAVLGDHDYWSGPNYVTRALLRRGVRITRNRNARVNVGRARVGLSLLTATYPRKPRKRTLRTLARGVANRDLRIMVGHQPLAYLARFADKNNYQLFLAGHTHGGQMSIYVPGRFLSASNIETGFVSGLYRLKKTLVYVNNGLGMTLAPFRFQAPATVSLLELFPQ